MRCLRPFGLSDQTLGIHDAHNSASGKKEVWFCRDRSVSFAIMIAFHAAALLALWNTPGRQRRGIDYVAGGAVVAMRIARRSGRIESFAGR